MLLVNRTLKTTLCAALAFALSLTLPACSNEPDPPDLPSSPEAPANTGAGVSSTPASSDPTAAPVRMPIPDGTGRSPPPLPPVASATAEPFVTAAPSGSTPTLDALRNIPDRGVITSTYVVRRGDTLSGIAAVTGASV